LVFVISITRDKEKPRNALSYKKLYFFSFFFFIFTITNLAGIRLGGRKAPHPTGEIGMSKKDRENREIAGLSNEDIIEYSPAYQRPFDTEYRRIDEILNIPLIIKNVVFERYNDREIVHILAETLDGKEFATRTSSSVLLKQLRQFESLLKNGKKLKAKIAKRKRYYTLAPPR